MEMYDYCVKNNSYLIFIVLPIINRSEIKITYENFVNPTISPDKAGGTKWFQSVKK